MENELRTWAATTLAIADIKIDGDRPWDIQIKSDEVFTRIARQGSLGLGEAYMDGLWECAALDQFFAKALGVHLEEHVNLAWPVLKGMLKARLLNMQTPKLARKVGE